MTKREKKERIIGILEGLTAPELVKVYNTYLAYSFRKDEKIYRNDENTYNELYYNNPMEAVRAAMYGDFIYESTWIRVDAYSNLESTDDVSNWIDYDEVADFIIENCDSLMNNEIRDFLNSIYSFEYKKTKN
jgi:hypothetical protein